jgi:hypothetical protein
MESFKLIKLLICYNEENNVELISNYINILNDKA